MVKNNLLKRIAMVTVPLIGIGLAGQAYALNGDGKSKSEPVRFGSSKPAVSAHAPVVTGKTKVRYPTKLEGDMRHMFNLGRANDGQDATSFYKKEPIFAEAVDDRYGDGNGKLIPSEAKKFADERNRFNPAVNNYPQKCGDNYGIVYKDGSVAIIPGTALGGPNPDCNGAECIVPSKPAQTVVPTVHVPVEPEVPAIPDNYANLRGAEYMVVLPKVKGAFWPTAIKSNNQTTDMLGYDEDGSMRISKYEYPLSERAITTGILHEALAGNIETRRFSNGVLTNAIARKMGIGVGSDYVRDNGLEGILNQDSCFGEQGCTTFTPEEIVTAAGNLAVYNTSANIVIDSFEKENGVKIEDIEDLGMFANETFLEDYSKTLFGFLTPTNVITGASTDWTGKFANKSFKKGYKDIKKQLVSNFNGNTNQLFENAYQSTQNLFMQHYNGGNK